MCTGYLIFNSLLGYKERITTGWDVSHWAQSQRPCLQGPLDSVQNRNGMLLRFLWWTSSVVGHQEDGRTHGKTLPRPHQETRPNQSTRSNGTRIWTNNGMCIQSYTCYFFNKNKCKSVKLFVFGNGNFFLHNLLFFWNWSLSWFTRYFLEHYFSPQNSWSDVNKDQYYHATGKPRHQQKK